MADQSKRQSVTQADIGYPPAEYSTDWTSRFVNAVNLVLRATADRLADRIMRWAGTWESGNTYSAGDVVLDDGWLMIANKPTSDPASPQPIGNPYNVYQGNIQESTDAASQIIFGTRYTVSNPGYIIGYRVYAASGQHYTVYTITDPLGDQKINHLVSFTASNTGWLDLSSDATIANAGLVFDLVAITRAISDTPIVQALSYNYQTPNNESIPNAGEISHATHIIDIMRISYIDSDGGDNESLLLNLGIGDKIIGAGQTWLVQGSIAGDGYASVVVAPELQGGPDGVHDFTFETVIPTPLTYASDPDYWLNNPSVGQPKGLLGIDTTIDNITTDDSAYGTDVRVQEATISDDWDLMASTSGVSGGIGKTINTERVLDSRSYIDQAPLGHGVATQVTFGAAESNQYWSIDAAGAITCLLSDEYTLKLKLAVGRDGASGESQIYVRLLINGVPVGDPSHVIVDNSRIEIPQHYDSSLRFNKGDVITFEQIRDTDGDNSGGLKAGNPDVVGWGSSPSARIQMIRVYSA